MTLRAICAAAATAALLVAGCGDDDVLGVRPDVREGADRIWETDAEDLPSAYDFLSSRRLFLGGDDIGALGDVFLDGQSGELRLRSISGLVRALAVHAVELQDLGPVGFETVDVLPTEGYLEAEDEQGLAVVDDHVYALRITRSTVGANYAKVVVDAIGGEPGQRFIDFRFSAQVQAENPDVTEE